VWQGYGDVLFGLGRNTEAVQAYQRAVDLSLDTWSVRNNFGAHLRMIGQDSAAVEQFRSSLAQNPKQVVPLSQIPPALIAMGRYEEAERLADSIIVVANAPPIMLWLRSVADSAIRVHAPPGSIRIGLRAPGR
jgi:Flp pilus assembly protein TadD